MKKLILTFLLSVFPVVTLAAGGGYPLDKMSPDLSNQASLQRGAKYFMNYCAGCHSTKFQRYERVADDLAIPHQLMMDNLVFDQYAKIGDLMDNAMRDEEAKKWFGATPPDLTLVARVRGADWLYTYLRTFYEDTSRPWGVNNKVFPEVGMPHAMLELQGKQLDTCGDEAQGQLDPLTGELLCGLEVVEAGQMSTQEYDRAVYDLVNFLVYSGEPMQLKRQQLGWYVFLFLAVFLFFAYLLKKEYWKDVH